MKNIFLFIFLILSSHSFSQLQIGARVGMNLSWSHVSQKSTGGNFKNNSETLPGYQAGVISSFKLAKRIELQPSLIYTLKGWKYNYTDFLGYQRTAKVSAGYIELPVTVNYLFPLGVHKFSAGAGFYFSKGLSLVHKEASTIRGSFKTFSLKNTDFGAVIQAGWQYKNIYTLLVYEPGILNLNLRPQVTPEFWLKQTNNSVCLAVCYMFNLKSNRYK